MNCILHNVFFIKDCVTAVVIDGVEEISEFGLFVQGCTCTEKEVFYCV